MKNPYEVLGLTTSATQDEIKKAYRGLVKKFHPDLNPNNKAAEDRFKEISHAYETIGTAEDRAKFDRGETDEQLHQKYQQQQQNQKRYYNTQQSGGKYSDAFGDGLDQEDLFSSFFGGGARKARKTKGRDHQYKMEISLKEAILGGEKVVTLQTGKTLQVKIPAGTHEGAKLRFKGQGEATGSDIPAGDAIVEISIAPMAGFARKDNDLETELNISFIEAITGAELKVPTIDGPVMMKIPAGVNSGAKLRIKGKGVPYGSARGDQIVVLKIVMPKVLDPALKAEIESWNGRYAYNPRGES